MKEGIKKTRLKKKIDDEGGGTTDEGGGGSNDDGLSDTDTSSSDDAAFADDENDDEYDSARGTSSGNNSSSPETKTKVKREPDRPEPARLSPLEQPIKAVKEKQSPRHRIIDVPKSAGTAGKHTNTSLTNR